MQCKLSISQTYSPLGKIGKDNLHEKCFKKTTRQQQDSYTSCLMNKGTCKQFFCKIDMIFSWSLKMQLEIISMKKSEEIIAADICCHFL